MDMKKRLRPRRDLVICVAADLVLAAMLCWDMVWMPQAHPPEVPWTTVALLILSCWITVRSVLRFRELTGHWPDLKRWDLGAYDLKEEEKEP